MSASAEVMAEESIVKEGMAQESIVKQGMADELAVESIIKQGMADELAVESIVKEGMAEVIQPPDAVFYNPVQTFNRDLTVAVLSHLAEQHHRHQLQKKETLQRKETVIAAVREPESSSGQNGASTVKTGIRILEGLAASGLRSVRFALEVPHVQQVLANDFDQTAVTLIKRNIEHNRVEHLVTANCDDAAMVMYKHRHVTRRFHAVDLDPYGSPSAFLDGAVQCVTDGGILCITCTDMAILCGNAPETCYAKYGAVPLRTKFCHEMALRIVLQCVESHANRYSRYILPMLSVSVDFYVRIYVKVCTGQKKVKESVTKLSSVFHCNGCGSFALQPLATKVVTKGDSFKVTPAAVAHGDKSCRHCGQTLHVGGPIWTARLHDYDFVRDLLNAVESDVGRFETAQRIIGMLTVILEELPDSALYYDIDHLCNVLHCTPPKALQIRSAVLNAGYHVSSSHAGKNSLKTNAPSDVIWDIMRCWVKDNPVHSSRFRDNTPTKVILSKQPEVTANFELHPEANPESRRKKLVRWQINPERNWGPQARATKGHKLSLDERRLRGSHKSQQKRKPEVLDLKKYPCKRLREGICNEGDSCRYSHALETTSGGHGQDSAESCDSHSPDIAMCARSQTQGDAPCDSTQVLVSESCHETCSSSSDVSNVKS